MYIEWACAGKDPHQVCRLARHTRGSERSLFEDLWIIYCKYSSKSGSLSALKAFTKTQSIWCYEIWLWKCLIWILCKSRQIRPRFDHISEKWANKSAAKFPISYISMIYIYCPAYEYGPSACCGECAKHKPGSEKLRLPNLTETPNLSLHLFLRNSSILVAWQAKGLLPC